MPLQVTWGKCQTEPYWCTFLGLNLEHEVLKDLYGVYIIWQKDNAVIYTGSGEIKKRIAAHRNEDNITKYKNLYVTLAQVNKIQMKGIETYLYDLYKPLEGERTPDVTPIPVNTPW